MIRYALTCSNDHGFDSWFRDSRAFESQKVQGLITCPNCGTAGVEKAIMAPRLGRGEESGTHKAQSVLSPDDAEKRAFIRAFRAHVEANAEAVGSRFAEEARRIHYGESEARAIYGSAGEQDIRALLDEGVPIAPLPGLPDEQN